MKDTSQDFDQFYVTSDVEAVIQDYHDLEVELKNRKQFEADVTEILRQHIPQVFIAIGLGFLLGGILKGKALAMDNHGNSHLDGDHSGASLNAGGLGDFGIANDMLAPMSNTSADWTAKHVVFNPVVGRGEDGNIGIVIDSGSLLDTLASGSFADGLGIDRVQDFGVITLADNPSSEGIAWVLSGGKQGAIDANVVWLNAFSRGGDDHKERTALGTHVLGIKRFADGSMWVVASKMPNTGSRTLYAPVPTKFKSEVVELPLKTDGTNWGVETLDGGFQPLFVGQFDKTFKLPINEDDNKITEAAMPIFDSAVSNPTTEVVSRNDSLDTNDGELAHMLAGNGEPIAPEDILAQRVLFEQIGIDPSTYFFKMDKGVIVGIDKQTGEKIFSDGKFDLRYAVENAKNLMPTPFKPVSESEIGNINRPRESMFGKYFRPLYARARNEFKAKSGIDIYVENKSSCVNFMLDPEILAYGMVCLVNREDVTAPIYLIYELKNAKIVVLPVMSGSDVVAIDYWRKPTTNP